jgi:large subunit ribosomal protein L37Ae
MAAKKKKIKAAGRFGAGYGRRLRNKFNKVESVQRVKQICLFCEKPGVKRVAAGIWDCKKCGKKYASSAYALPN